MNNPCGLIVISVLSSRGGICAVFCLVAVRLFHTVWGTGRYITLLLLSSEASKPELPFKLQKEKYHVYNYLASLDRRFDTPVGIRVGAGRHLVTDASP